MSSARRSETLAASKTTKLCRDFPLGECRHGEKCNFVHPPLLDISLADQRNPGEDWIAPNEEFQACFRCMQMGKECDKVGRDPGPQDPCSECRHSGGANAKNCALHSSTYNDQLWHKMVSEKSEGQLLAWKQSVKNPMPDEKVKAGWQGLTADEVQARADWLPVYVRERPRSFLVPPRSTRKQVYAEKQNGQKRKRVAEESMVASMARRPTAPAAIEHPLPQVMMPPPHPVHGKIVHFAWDIVDGGEKVEVRYEDGWRHSTLLTPN